MADARVVASALSYGAVAVFYLFLGARLMRRPVQGRGARASSLFGLWWLGLGSHSTLAATMAIATAVDGFPPILVAAATTFAAVAIGVMSYGLAYYMLYLLTGSARVVRALAWVYVPLSLALVVSALYARPVAVEMEGWIPMIRYARPEGAALDGLASLTFIIPPFLASGVYAALFLRVKDPAKRWRIAMTGGALFTWLVTSLLLGGLATDVAAVIGRSIALAAAICAYLAYEPPAWARRRYGAVPLHEEVLRPPVDPTVALARREALAARARELV